MTAPRSWCRHWRCRPRHRTRRPATDGHRDDGTPSGRPSTTATSGSSPPTRWWVSPDRSEAPDRGAGSLRCRPWLPSTSSRSPSPTARCRRSTTCPSAPRCRRSPACRPTGPAAPTIEALEGLRRPGGTPDVGGRSRPAADHRAPTPSDHGAAGGRIHLVPATPGGAALRRRLHRQALALETLLTSSAWRDWSGAPGSGSCREASSATGAGRRCGAARWRSRIGQRQGRPCPPPGQQRQGDRRAAQRRGHHPAHHLRPGRGRAGAPTGWSSSTVAASWPRDRGRAGRGEGGGDRVRFAGCPRGSTRPRCLDHLGGTVVTETGFPGDYEVDAPPSPATVAAITASTASRTCCSRTCGPAPARLEDVPPPHLGGAATPPPPSGGTPTGPRRSPRNREGASPSRG